jgi:hypothetical protein
MTDDRYPGAGTARWLGYLGLIPFLAGGALALLGNGAASAFGVRAVIAYGAVIVSFVGAIHWGLALHNGAAQSARLYFVSVLPSLVAWPALLLPSRPGLVLLIAAFVLVWLYERGHLWSRLFPPWFARLRTQLTAVAVIVLTLLLVAAPGA